MLWAVTRHLLRNVALNQRSYQISTLKDSFGFHSGGLANDGSRQTDHFVILNGCAHSLIETNPWWAVDLGAATLVVRVDLTNRDSHGTDLDWCYLYTCLRYMHYILRIVSLILRYNQLKVTVFEARPKFLTTS